MMNANERRKAKTITTLIAGLTAATLLVGCGDQTKTNAGGDPNVPVATASPMGEHAGHDMSASPSGSGGDAASPAGHDMGSMGGGAHAMGGSGLSALKGLKGKAFDVAFLSQMIAHHEAAVIMAKQALGSAAKPETKREAQKVIDAQAKEIAQMTGWLKAWYNTAPSKAQQALVNADMKSMMEMPVTSDQMFFQMMIPHHQGAIDMSELVPARSERPEVKKLAEQIIRDQKAEIAAYQRLTGSGG